MQKHRSSSFAETGLDIDIRQKGKLFAFAGALQAFFIRNVTFFSIQNYFIHISLSSVHANFLSVLGVTWFCLLYVRGFSNERLSSATHYPAELTRHHGWSTSNDTSNPPSYFIVPFSNYAANSTEYLSSIHKLTTTQFESISFQQHTDSLNFFIGTSTASWFANLHHILPINATIHQSTVHTTVKALKTYHGILSSFR